MGAGNVYREIGHGAGVFVAIIDITKGFVPVLMAKDLELPILAVVLTGMATVAGHAWPLFLDFWGGGGAATVTGALLAFLPRETLLAMAMGVLVLLVTRRRQVGFSAYFTLIVFMSWIAGEGPLYAMGALAMILVVGVRVYQQERAKLRRVAPKIIEEKEAFPELEENWFSEEQRRNSLKENDKSL